MHRITTTMCLTPEELEFLVHRLRPKADADRATREIIRNINNAASSALTGLSSDIGWITRGPADEPIYDILSDIWIRSCQTGEFRMAQLHRRKGFLVHIIRNPALGAYLKSHDFVCLETVPLMIEALENFLKTGHFEAEILPGPATT